MHIYEVNLLYMNRISFIKVDGPDRQLKNKNDQINKIMFYHKKPEYPFMRKEKTNQILINKR